MKRGIRELEEDFFGFVEDATSKIRKVREDFERGSHSEEGAEHTGTTTVATRRKFLEEMERTVASIEREASEETARVGMTVFSLKDLYDTCLTLYNQQNEALGELQEMVLQLGVNPYPKRNAERERPEEKEGERDTEDYQECKDNNGSVHDMKSNDTNGQPNDEETEEERKMNEEKEKEPKEEEEDGANAQDMPSSQNYDNDSHGQSHPHKRSVSLADFGISKETQMAILANKKSGDRASLFHESKERRSTHSGRDSLSSESVLSRADSVLDASRRLTASTSYPLNGSEPVKASKSFFLPGSSNNNDGNENPMNGGGGGGLFPICRINKFKTK